MDFKNYKEDELRYYKNIYNYLKVSMRSDLSGNISATDVEEFLISASKLPHDKILQIGTITGAQGWYAEKQLFEALKLVAAAQQGIPVSPSTPTLDLDLPLPVLVTNNNIQFEKDLIDLNERNNASSPDLIQLSDSDGPLTKRDVGYEIMVSEEVDDETADGAVGRHSLINASRSPSVSSPGSDSPTPTNSLHEKKWSKTSESQWQSLVNEEHRQLLGTEEDSSDRHSSDDNDEHYDNDLFIMTDEQKKYYLQQFLTMQPDVDALIPGNIAKEFFEKSRLPTSELSKIWQLADVSKDGALSLEEFHAAMHLVVLRRNHIRLPEFLPDSLMPKTYTLNAQKSIESASDSSSTTNISFNSESKNSFDTSIEQKLPQTKNEKNLEEFVTISPTKGKEWAKFVDSPTSTLSSPGPKPCNFDFQRSAVEKDPKILHPKALRVTPEAMRLEDECRAPSQESDTFPFDGRGHAFKSPLQKTPPVAIMESNDKVYRISKCTEGKNISPNKHISHRQEDDERLYGSSSLSAVPGPTKREMPPPPPPRPTRTHMRSSSLDLNKAQKNNLHPGNLPAVPPRTSPNTGSPQRVLLPHTDMEGSHWEHRLSDVSEDPAALQTDATRTSAFEVYKKPNADEVDFGGTPIEAEKSITNRGPDKRDILSSLYTMKEKNSVLLRVNSELNQELAEVIEERIALQFQLEQMKPFSN